MEYTSSVSRNPALTKGMKPEAEKIIFRKIQLIFFIPLSLNPQGAQGVSRAGKPYRIGISLPLASFPL